MNAQPNKKNAATYHAYLLRVWAELEPGAASRRDWRFSLEDVQAGTRRGFRDLDSLLVFLHDLTKPDPNCAGPAE
jgi:hypothetical protein